ncbi:MAG TPA: DHA2 family efflux MFS transporter permease subunit [Gemmatimonadaceae bacterium]|nr:DHA2 family efflux MFS transporter permease subunit [Gemmatimonadaceae bacterium]
MTDATALVDEDVQISAGPRGTARFVGPAVSAAVPEDKYKYKYLIAIAVTLAAVLELIDTSIVNVAIPHMMGNLGATLDEISWVSTGYIIANVIVIPMSGWLSAFFGRKRYLTGSILLFVLASFMCGAATSLVGLVLWRVVQGFGGGALLSTAQATLFESFPPEEVGIGQAMFGVGVMVGPTIGPTLGGYIVDNYNWPWIFYINVPLGILAAIMVYTYVHDAEHQERAKTIDVWGIALLALGVGSLQWMLERGERYDWFDSRFVTTLCVVSVTSFVLLLWRELTIDEPVINFRVLKSRQLSAGVSIAAFLGLALYGSIFVLPVFLQQLHGFTANQTGMVILPGALASAAMMVWVGRNANHLDARVTVTIGALMFLVSMWMLSTLTLDAGQHDLFWPLIIRGAALGLIFVPLTNASMADLSMRELAQGTGMFNLTRQLGGSLGIAIMATLLSRFTTQARSTLVTHVSTTDPVTYQRLQMLTQGMIAKGASPIVAHQQALAILDHQVMAQASVVAFSKIYLLSGLLLVASIPLLMFFHTGKARTTIRDLH